MVSKDNGSSIYNFLLTAVFSEGRGYSYSELIGFLKNFQYYYKECYMSMEMYKKELEVRKLNYGNADTIMGELKERMKEKENENAFLYQKMNRKLTLKERITGKLNITF